MPTAKKTLPKTYKGKSTRPGGGGRAAMMHDALAKKGLPESEIGAIIGTQARKDYGPKKAAEYSAAGRKRAARARSTAAKKAAPAPKKKPAAKMEDLKTIMGRKKVK